MKKIKEKKKMTNKEIRKEFIEESGLPLAYKNASKKQLKQDLEMLQEISKNIENMDLEETYNFIEEYHSNYEILDIYYETINEIYMEESYQNLQDYKEEIKQDIENLKQAINI